MKKIFKQSFSLALALLMVLSLIPAMPLAANAEDFTPGETWTVESTYAGKLEGAFTTSGDDFVFEADETLNWKAWLRSAVAVDKGINVKGTLTYNGQKLEKTVQGLSVAKGGTIELCSTGSFPEITDDMYGNFTLTVQIYHGTKLAATGVLNFIRNEPAPVETEPVETEPVETEPVETNPPKVEYKAEWTYKTGYEFINGAFNTAEEDFIFAGTPYDWTVTINSDKSTGARIDATLETQDGQVLTASKEVTIPVGEFQLFDYTAFPALTNELIGNFKLTTTITVKLNGVETAVAQLVAVFGRSAAYVEPQPEEPGKVEYKAEWTYKTGYEFINGSFNTAEEDFIFAGTPYDWTVTVNSEKSAGARVDATLETQDGQILTASKELTIPVGEFQLFDYTAFSALTNELIGNFKLTTTITVKLNGVETPVAQLVAVFGRSAAYVEPETPADPAKPGYVDWQYANSSEGVSYDWLNGAISTNNETGIYKGWEPYDWAITLSPTKSAATVIVEAEVIDHTGTVVGTANKTVDVSRAPSVTTILTAGDLGLSTKTVGDFRVTAVLKYADPETGDVSSIAQVQAVFGRRIGDAGYTKAEYKSGNEWINIAFNDDVKSYVGTQPYSWSVSVAPTLQDATFDATATVINAQGEVVATLTKTGVKAGKTITTTVLTAKELADLTTDLYGQFAVTCVLSVGTTQYAGVYGVFERVEGVWEPPYDPAPEFTPSVWENCGLPEAIVVTNNGEKAKKVSVEIDLNGNKMTKTVDVAVGASATLVTTNQLRTVIKERGTTYTVTITGYWKNEDQQVDINEALTYTWAEHTNTEVVPGYAATCTETGLTDGVFCHGCNGTITKQEDIPVDPEAHTFVDGTCACGATNKPELLKFIGSTTVALQNSIALQFVIDPDLDDDGVLELIGADNVAVITKLNKTTGAWEPYCEIPQGDWGEYNGNRFVAACQIAARQMTDEFKVILVNNAGDQISLEYSDSGRAYGMRAANTLIKQAPSSASKAKQLTMFVDFLNYGAAAQINFGYNTNDLANSELTDAQRAYATASVTIDNKRTGAGSSQVNVKDRIELSFLFPQDLVKNDMYAVITYTHFTGVEETLTITGEEFDTYTNNKGVTQWKLQVPNIGTPDGNQLITCVVYDANDVEVTRAQDSVNSYMSRVLEAANATANLKALATAALKLTTSSYDFFKK